MQTKPNILCLCPTYKRPDCVRNLLACFLAQDYEHKTLLVLDDANQFDNDPITGSQALTPVPYYVVSTPHRCLNLPSKFNMMAAWAANHIETDFDILVVTEDDDVYLPWHLNAIAAAFERGGEYFISSQVWSTYNESHKGAHLEPSGGRFHASTAFTAVLFDRIGGYPITDRLDFDQQMRARCLNGANKVEEYDKHVHPTPFHPSYVYRWGNAGWGHGSAVGEDKYKEFWDSLGKLPAPHQGKLVPVFDGETKMLYKMLAGIEV